MQGKGGNPFGALQWVVVLVVGVFVAAVVLGLNLIPRLNAGQKVLDGARPAFAPARVAADRAGVDLIGANVAMANPLVTPSGGGAAEVPKLVAFVSAKTGLSQAQVVAALQKNFPHTLALLQTIPLSAVTAEEPGLFAFLEKALHVTQPQLLAALQKNFPAITQAVTTLPAVTNGWDAVPNLGGATRFDGTTPIKSVPDVAAYFSSDVIPVLENQQANYKSLDNPTTWNWIAPLLLAVAIIVIVFAVFMMRLNAKGKSTKLTAIGGAGVVTAVGLVVVLLSIAISVIPRTSNGQKLLDGLKPVNDPARIQADRGGIDIAATIMKLEDPIMTEQGGAAAEVPKLVAFVAKGAGLTQPQVIAALQTNFPHTLALLQMLPVSGVSAEVPGLLTFLEQSLKVDQAGLLAALKANFPGLAAAITNVSAVTNGWNDVPGVNGATNFAGTPMKTLPQVATYFSTDVVPVLETQNTNYKKLTSVSKINFVGPVVEITGIIVVAYGIFMLVMALQGFGIPGARRPYGASAVAAPSS